MWLMTVISGPATGSRVLMWQLRDIHSKQMNWQKTNACASVFSLVTRIFQDAKI